MEKRWYCTADTGNVLCKHTNHLSPQHPVASCKHHVDYIGKKIMNSRNAKVTFPCLMDHFAQQGCVTAWKKKQTLLWSASHCFQSLGYLTVRGYTELGGYFRVHSQISGPQGSLVFLWYVWGTTLKNLFKIKACRSNTLHPQEKEHSRMDLHHSLSLTPADPEKQLSTRVTSSTGTVLLSALQKLWSRTTRWPPEAWPPHFLFPWLLISSLMGANHAPLKPCHP